MGDLATNTESLQAILNTVKGLPSAGASIQVVTGKTYFGEDGWLYAYCGFDPDVVVFDLGEYYQGSARNLYYSAVMYLNNKNQYGPILLTTSNTYKYFTFYDQGRSGGSAWCLLYGTLSNWGETQITSGFTFNFTAIKYT